MEKIVTLELTDKCNFRCIMCDQSRRKGAVHGLPTGFMDRKALERSLEALDGFEITMLTPYWVGEAMLHPDFEGIFRLLFRLNSNNRIFRHLSLNTNGALMDEKKREALLDAARGNYREDTFVRLHFSIDAAKDLTYRTIKQGGALGETLAGIRAFLDGYRERELRFPRLTFAFIVQEANRREAADFVAFWKDELGSRGIEARVTYDWPEGMEHGIYLRRLDSPDRQMEAELLHRKVALELGLIKEEELGTRILNLGSILKEEEADPTVKGKRVRPPCAGPFKTPVVHHSGLVTVCCFDIGLKLSTGSIKEKTLKEIWQSEELQELRCAHLLGRLEKYPACASCTNLNTPLLSFEEVEEYCQESSLPFPERLTGVLPGSTGRKGNETGEEFARRSVFQN